MTDPREKIEYWLGLALTAGANKQDFNVSEAVRDILLANEKVGAVQLSGNPGELKSGDHAELARLAGAALDAFDRLHGATIGKADDHAVRDHFGTTSAFEVRIAKQDADRIRNALASLEPKT